MNNCQNLSKLMALIINNTPSPKAFSVTYIGATIGITQYVIITNAAIFKLFEGMYVNENVEELRHFISQF